MPSLPVTKRLTPTGETNGVADIVRPGDDITIVATQQMRHRALQAADRLAGQGYGAEVIDPRTLAPFDYHTVITSLAKTSRLLVVQEGPPDGGWAASLIGRLCSGNFELFDAPPALITSDPTPVPYSSPMEDAWLPGPDRIVSEALRLLAY